MTTRKKPETGKGKGKTLKLKKETIRDLDTTKKRGDVKGGRYAQSCMVTCVASNCRG